MDRNYFLSYGHKVALILLLAAIGKLNAKLISVAANKAELLYYTDVNNALHFDPAGVSIHHVKSRNTPSGTAQDGNDHKSSHKIHHYIIRNSYPSIDGKYSFLSCLKTFKCMTVWYKWSLFYFVNSQGLNPFDETKKFCINPFKLIDGFKLIIKIPDKLSSPYK
ncbi:hypothetical protein EGY05_18780 [Chryseobacterium arthrosphaerae]|uniref:hypothetical protein n=1 Tax=Chryseobacterium arthrosphaerae TaxID=651561 RepID=UPI000F4E3EDD|nr:hypothetical protein [Chryseobacterium arthrosphaerae]AYZ13861.1 hypothetical protein EGY05_18780 [Chryseobacterium arthrosphaerae]